VVLAHTKLTGMMLWWLPGCCYSMWLLWCSRWFLDLC